MSVWADTKRADDSAVQAILSDLHDRIGPQRFNAWFRGGVRIAVEEGHVSVAVPNPFVGNWIEAHYQSAIAAAAAEHTGRKRPVLVTVDPDLSGAQRRRQLDKQAEMVERATAGRARPRRAIQQAPLRYRLEDFVVGTSNKLAHSAAVAVVSAASPPFNPLFVHGSCGVGKTHLLQGVCAMANRGGRPGRFVTAIASTSLRMRAALSSASLITMLTNSTCLREAVSGTMPPNRAWRSIWEAMTSERIFRPSSTTDAVVSSQLVSMPRILIGCRQAVPCAPGTGSGNRRSTCLRPT